MKEKIVTLENLKRFLTSVRKRANYLEIADLISDFLVVIAFPIVACKGAWYPITIVVLADIFRLFLRGAWYYIPFHSTAHSHNPSKDFNAILYSVTKITLVLILAAIKFHETIIKRTVLLLEYTRSWIWYVIVTITIIETFRCLLHTIHKYDDDWLYKTNGNIGIPNWISIIRIAVVIITPHIYITQSAGKNSNLIATIIVILAIVSDAVDGFVARKTRSVTKVGKYLDPLSDKAIFFPNAIALIWLLYRDSFLIGSKRIFLLTALFATVAIIRDVIFFVWFFMAGKKIPSGIGASTVDKKRMAAICFWLISTVLALFYADGKINSFATLFSIFFIIVTAYLSILSIKTDYGRLHDALNQKSSY